MYHHRRKKRLPNGTKIVEVARGKNGYGFTISGEHPCILSCIVSGSPADLTGLKTGDLLLSVNGKNVSNAYHDDVVRLIGSSRGVLALQIAENMTSSESSDDDFHGKPSRKYNHRYKKSYDEFAAPHPISDRPLSNKYARSRSTHDMGGISARSRSQSPYRYREERGGSDHRFHQPRVMGVENINPMIVPPQRQKQPRKLHHSSTKHTIITREHRLGISNSDESQPKIKHVREVSSSSSSSSNAYHQLPEDRKIAHNGGGGVGPLHDHRQSQMKETKPDIFFNEPAAQLVVGYVGSIELPNDDKMPAARLHALRSAVRRLRMERKVHTMILMHVTGEGVDLINTLGSMVASYPADKVCFSGVCPEDEHRFFGIVTVHGNDAGDCLGSSCHVFMVDPDLAPHAKHVQKAYSFGIKCSHLPGTEFCREFPQSARLVIRCLSGLHQTDQPPTLAASSFTDAGSLNATHDRVCVVELTSDMSADMSEKQVEDGSIGWHSSTRSGGENNSLVSTQGMSVSEEDTTGINISDISEIRAVGESHHSASLIQNVSNSSQTSDKLNVRAMPDPHGYLMMASCQDMLGQQNSADNIRKTIQKVIHTTTNVQQPHKKPAPDLPHPPHTTENTDSFVPPKTSESFAPSSEVVENVKNPSSGEMVGKAALFPGSSSGISLKSELEAANRSSSSIKSATLSIKSIADPGLPPVTPQYLRIKPPVPPAMSGAARGNVTQTPARPKSTPPIRGVDTGSEAVDGGDPVDYDSDPGSVSAMIQDESWNGQIPETVPESPMPPPPVPPPRGVGLPADGVRRHSEGFPLKQQNATEEKFSVAKAELLKQSRLHSRRTISHSHESLVAGGGGGDDWASSSHGITPAASVAHLGRSLPQPPTASPPADPPAATTRPPGAGGTVGRAGGQTVVAGRAASWAVSFDNLLGDPAGRTTFTEFLKKEFSEENIVFWEKVEKYKEIASQEKRKQAASELFSQHLSTSASDPVNIDASTRQATQDALTAAPRELFDAAQKHIYQLMKQDSFSRFLKSPLYKDSVVADMEGRELPCVASAGHQVANGGVDDSKSLKSVSSNEDQPGEKRRRSLLPWNRNKSEKKLLKTATEPDLIKSGEFSKREEKLPSRPSLDLADLKKITKEITTTQGGDGEAGEGQTFVRVVLPDGSTAVIYAAPSDKLVVPLKKLCDRRNLQLGRLDVYMVATDRLVSVASDMSSVASKEVRLARRCVVRVDFPAVKRSLAVKAAPAVSVREAVEPAAARVGINLAHMAVYQHDSDEPIDWTETILTVENQRLVITPLPATGKDWGRSSRNKPPPVPKPRASTAANDTHRDLVLDELLAGDPTLNMLFDEKNVFDPENKKMRRSGSSWSVHGGAGWMTNVVNSASKIFSFPSSSSQNHNHSPGPHTRIFRKIPR